MGDGGDDGDADGRGEASGKYLVFEPRIPFPDASPLRTPRVKWENRVNLAGRPNGTEIIILQDGDGNVNGGDGRLGAGMGDGGNKCRGGCRGHLF